MKTYFVDTNVVLDVLLENENVWQDSLMVFQLAEAGQIRAFLSSSSLTDIFYMVRKRFSIPIAREAINRLLKLFDARKSIFIIFPLILLLKLVQNLQYVDKLR
jgi:predicted nucleic acid-binding protein